MANAGKYTIHESYGIFKMMYLLGHLAHLQQCSIHVPFKIASKWAIDCGWFAQPAVPVNDWRPSSPVELGMFFSENVWWWSLNQPKLGGGNSNMSYVHPNPWENDPIWRAYFSNGLVQPPTRKFSHIQNNLKFISSFPGEVSIQTTNLMDFFPAAGASIYRKFSEQWKFLTQPTKRKKMCSKGVTLLESSITLSFQVFNRKVTTAGVVVSDDCVLYVCLP